MSDIEIDYWLDGELFASRTRPFVPRQSDLIQFRNTLCRVESVCWVENDVPKVQIGLVEE